MKSIESRVDELISINGELASFINEGIKPYNGKPPDFLTLEFISLNFITRIRQSFDAVKCLLQDYKLSTDFEMSICLLLRAGLSDSLIVFHFVSLIDGLDISDNEKANDKVKKEIKELLSDNYIRLIRDGRNHVKRGSMSEQSFNEINNYLLATFPFLSMESKGTMFPSASMIYNDERHKGNLKVAVERAYDLFSTFSKYEHFGIISFYLSRLRRNEFQSSFSLILESERVFIHALKFCFLYLSISTNQELIIKMDEFIEKLNLIKL